jgi:hypothetical protein
MIGLSHTETIREYFESINGYFMYEIRPIYDPETPLLRINDDFEIVTLTYITKYAVSISQRAQYFQLDSSFKAIFPYVYSIPLGICNNDSFPLGLQLSASENSVHYSTFFAELSNGIGIPNFFEGKIFLSDMGTGLKKFYKDFKIKYFYCYRHILERLGQNTFAALIVRKLLFTSVLSEFQYYFPQARSDLNYMYRKHQLTQKQILFIQKLFNLNLSDGEFTPKMDPIDFTQALWNRAGFGVSTCSNHIERMHRTCNAATKLLKDPLQKLKAIILQIDLRFENAFSNPHKQAKATLVQMQKKAAKLNIPKGAIAVDNLCFHPYCNWSSVYSNRFQIRNFPCIHTCLEETRLTFDPNLYFIEVVPEEKIIEREYNGNCIFRTRPAVLHDTPIFNDEDDQMEYFQNAATIEETSPLFTSSTKYLYELAHEIIKVHNLLSIDFFNVFSKLAMDWSLFLQKEHQDEDNVEVRSKFKYKKWLEYKPIPNNDTAFSMSCNDHNTITRNEEEEDVSNEGSEDYDEDL